jgi:archaeal flagellar protein FlaJ
VTRLADLRRAWARRVALGQDLPRARRLAVSVGAGGATFLVLVLTGPFHGLVWWLITAALSLTVAALAWSLPRLLDNRRGGRIDDDMPFFITHFGVLATASLPRGELLRTLSENKEYEEIAAEMGRILRLTTAWGLGLSDAVRAVAQSTPSKTFSAFLLRLAHALEAGQPLETFLMSEQRVVMDEYRSLYEANLLRIESWKEIYANSIMTVGFLSVFAAVLPLFTGASTIVFTAATAGLTILLEIMMGLVLVERLPKDRLTPFRPLRTPFQRRLQTIFFASLATSLVVGALVAWRFGFGFGLLAAALPMLVPGVYADREEKAIRQREADYPALMRSLGAAATARGGAVRNVLGNLLANNLGALTQPVRELHRRLMWRVDDHRSWRAFGENTESRLIDSFTDMFVQGIGAGGKAGPISEIISKNMLDILSLRASRRATAGTFRGLLLGLGAGLAAVLFMGSGIIANLTDTFDVGGDVLVEQGLFTLPAPGHTELAQNILLVLLLVHGIAAGIFFELVQGGRIEGASLHAALNVAVAVAAGMLVLWGLPSLGLS